MRQRCIDTYRWVHWKLTNLKWAITNFSCHFLESLCTSKKNQDRCHELIVECVFLEKKSDTKKSSQGGLTVFQEFQLVLVLAQYFSRPGPDVTRNAMFLCLFGHTTLTPVRSRVLSKFISTAISDSIAPVWTTIYQKPGISIDLLLLLLLVGNLLDSLCSWNMDATSRTKFDGMLGIGTTADWRLRYLSKGMLWPIEITTNGCTTVTCIYFFYPLKLHLFILIFMWMFYSQICGKFHNISIGFVF